MLFLRLDGHCNLQELQKHGSPDIVMALVGNKADLQEKREVQFQASAILSLVYSVCPQIKHLFCIDVTDPVFVLQDGIDYAEKNGMFFIETSAKTADNINQLFEVFWTSAFNFVCYKLLTRYNSSDRQYFLKSFSFKAIYTSYLCDTSYWRTIFCRLSRLLVRPCIGMLVESMIFEILRE